MIAPGDEVVSDCPLCPEKIHTFALKVNEKGQILITRAQHGENPEHSSDWEYEPPEFEWAGGRRFTEWLYAVHGEDTDLYRRPQP